MKPSAIVIGCCAILAGCNKGPTVSVKNATGNEVAQAVKQSGVMDSDTMIEPGLWQSKVTILDMNVPGVPPQYADQMKKSLAAHRDDTNTHCVTAAEVKKPKADFFGADKSCKYDHFTMGGGKIDIQMVCNEQGATNTSSMSGTYTPTTYSMDMSMNASGGQENGMTMKMHVDSKRVGECTGKES